MMMGVRYNPTSPVLSYGGTMRNSKTDGTTKPVDSMPLKDIQEFLYELERLGIVRRTGEFQNGNPVFISTVEVNAATGTQRNQEG